MVDLLTKPCYNKGEFFEGKNMDSGIYISNSPGTVIKDNIILGYKDKIVVDGVTVETEDEANKLLEVSDEHKG